MLLFPPLDLMAWMEPTNNSLHPTALLHYKLQTPKVLFQKHKKFTINCNHNKSTLTNNSKKEQQNKMSEVGQEEQQKQQQSLYTKEDLIELIRAIKFSSPEASIRTVHNEIITNMSQNDSFEFLSTVKLNDVKKVWKKAITGAVKNDIGSITSNASASTGCKNDAKDNTKDTANIDEKQITKDINDEVLSNIKQKAGKNGIIKFYTVGDGSVKTLAANYTLQAAARVVADEKALKEMEQKEKESGKQEEINRYVHCFLDVPADCSGGKPQQALINFNDNTTKNKAKKISKKGASLALDDRDIVKIQYAAPLPGMDNMPMLLYNVDRSAKTFIHDDNDDENEGYRKIKSLIDSHGISGKLSNNGGKKAYFYSRISRRKDQPDLISIDVVELAPFQNW